jgi:F0F1-type ATP synthase assembly protein I
MLAASARSRPRWLTDTDQDMSLRLDSDAAARPGGLASARRELWSGVDHANIMSIELLAAILTWTAIGWFVDRALGTAPWFIVIGGLVGNFAGLYLIWLRSQRMDAADAATRTPPATAGGGGHGAA